MLESPESLFERIDSQLTGYPCISLSQLWRNLGVGRQLIEKTVRLVARTTFRNYQIWLSISLS